MQDRHTKEVNLYVGERLRLLRVIRGINQATLAESLGVSFQQLQKYERGANRISAGAIFTAAKALGVDVKAFFPGSDNGDDSYAVYPERVMTLMQQYTALEDKRLRDLFISLMRRINEITK